MTLKNTYLLEQMFFFQILNSIIVLKMIKNRVLNIVKVQE
jgi:hypothetical protein